MGMWVLCSGFHCVHCDVSKLPLNMHFCSLCFSGGIKRDWVGVPRQYFTPGEETSKCVCVRTTGPPSDNPESKSNRGNLDNPSLREYEGCDPKAIECYFKE